MTEIASSAENWLEDVGKHDFERALGKLRALAVVGRANHEAENAVTRVVEALEALRAKNYEGATKTSLDGWESLLQLEVIGVPAALAALVEADGNWRSSEDKVRDALARARDCWLTRAEAENSLGVLEAVVENTDTARGHFQAALAADPRHYRAITNLGNLELESGNLERAEELYKQVIQINPDYSVVYNNLAAVMRKRGKRFESVEYLKKSQRLYMRELRGQTKGTGIGKPQASAITGLLSNQAVRWGLLIAVLFVIWRFVLKR
jgi:tetratricopeptide (TPR) repeat protein